jgi:competence transcription factor ComK
MLAFLLHTVPIVMQVSGNKDFVGFCVNFANWEVENLNFSYHSFWRRIQPQIECYLTASFVEADAHTFQAVKIDISRGFI